MKQQPGLKRPWLEAPQVDMTQIPLMGAAKLSIDPAYAGRRDACLRQGLIWQGTAVMGSAWPCLYGMLRCAAGAQHGSLGRRWAQGWKGRPCEGWQGDVVASQRPLTWLCCCLLQVKLQDWALAALVLAAAPHNKIQQDTSAKVLAKLF